jgi:capsular polysaccharide biosynthesis protein
VLSLPTERPCLVEKLLFPCFLSGRFSGYLPPVYREWFLDRVAPPHSSRHEHRILISRPRTSKDRGRYMENEDELFRALEPLGFRRYTLDSMPVEEQVALFHDADIVVGAHGAGLSNVIFADRAKVLELFPASFVTPHYYFLSKACGHAYRYVYGTRDDRNANLVVNVRAVLSTLQEMGS